MNLRTLARPVSARFICVALVLASSLGMAWLSGANVASAAPQNKPSPPEAKAAAQPAPTPAPAIAPAVQAVLDSISADSLRGHLSFIASDLLEGRDTPSRGLDIAAEYIAAQFRRAGLEPVGDPDAAGQKSYFQIAHWRMAEPDPNSFALTVQNAEQQIAVAANQVTMIGVRAYDIAQAGVVRLDTQAAEALAAFKPEQLAGRVLIVTATQVNSRETLGKLLEAKPALFVMLDRASANGRGVGARRLLDPEAAGNAGIALLQLQSPEAVKLIDALPAGETTAKLTLKLALKQDEPVNLKNVVALLRGADPVLQNTCVLVTAHYDHLGVRASGEGDRINNGANDDGSGTVSVIELATALAKLKERPKRSILFMTVFGEEKGLLGSRYYGRHPIFPIEKTVADVNLEHVGRTDDSEGDRTGTATLTGFDYTDVGPIFEKAGELTGIRVYKHPQNSDSFFGRSDNQALADQGVPAHTLCVAFIFPDYHQVGDHWDKINYPNLAQTNRMVALALLTIADNATEPKWNEANPKTERYVKAWKARHGQ
ncbi:MAG: M28 family peptidase [Acidobacteria bacterium]|nr:M28 family peptidase [Acidobacteriota bacterium]MBI3428439.1 M28 family peptidase [Acidobacteriota bacterium]